MKERDNATKKILEKFLLLNDKEQEAIVWITRHMDDVEKLLGIVPAGYADLNALALKFTEEGNARMSLMAIYKKLSLREGRGGKQEE